MIKRMSVITQKPGMSDKEFFRHWKDIHGPLAKRLPYVLKYVQNHIVDKKQKFDADRGTVEADGIVEFWFDSVEKMNEAFTSEPGQALIEDGMLFLGTVSTWIVQEHQII